MLAKSYFKFSSNTLLTICLDYHDHDVFSPNQDKSGTISQTELRQVMQTLGVRCSEPEFKALLENIDTNGDGVVDFEEFTKLLTSFL